MTVSVFTPSHDPRWLDDCYTSLAAQTYGDWEWIVVLNNGARWTRPDDLRVRVYVVDQLVGVGAGKSYACEQATGDLLVELDHDDYLAPDALAAVVEAATARPDAALIYSDFAQVDDTLRTSAPPFSPAHGWAYEPVAVEVHGEERKVLATRALDADYPHNAALIWYAPNHVRAFPRWAYQAAGGYDWRLTVLDDQDLLARLYQHGPFVRVPRCLYLQRWHATNTQAAADTNTRIQTETVQRYDDTIQALALTWARRRHLAALDLGAAHGSPPGYLGVDQHPGPNVSLTGDIFDVLAGIADSSVGVIRAVDFLEHIADRVRLFNECHRVLAHGGLFLTLTPSTDGRGAFQDPTHVSFYNENALWYFTEPGQAAYVPEITARFQASRVHTGYPTDWHREHDIPYLNANLIAVKPGGARQGGVSGWADALGSCL